MISVITLGPQLLEHGISLGYLQHCTVIFSSMKVNLPRIFSKKFVLSGDKGGVNGSVLPPGFSKQTHICCRAGATKVQLASLIALVMLQLKPYGAPIRIGRLKVQIINNGNPNSLLKK